MSGGTRRRGAGSRLDPDMLGVLGVLGVIVVVWGVWALGTAWSGAPVSWNPPGTVIEPRYREPQRYTAEHEYLASTLPAAVQAEILTVGIGAELASHRDDLIECVRLYLEQRPDIPLGIDHILREAEFERERRRMQAKKAQLTIQEPEDGQLCMF